MLSKMLDKLLIALPTKGRADTINKHTWSWLQYIKEQFVVWVEREEFEEYSRIIPKDHLVVLPKSNQGLGYAKEQIKKFAEENEFEYIFKVDDDIAGWCDATRGSSKKGEAGAKVLKQALQDCIEELEKHPQVGAIGFPYRNEMWDVKKWVSVNGRLQTAYISRTKDFHADKRISHFEDLAHFINLRAHNRSTLRYGLIGIDCEPVGKNAGGHQLMDRGTQAQSEIDLIRSEIYPALRVKRVFDKAWNFEPDLKGGIFTGAKL